jgi:hypothetical protein
VAPAAALIVKTRWLLNLALLVLVAGLGLFAWLRPADRSDARPPLTPTSPDRIARVAIDRADREPILLEREAGGWRMAAPVRARANSFAIDSLLRLASAPVELSLPDAEPERYGLQRPGLTVRLDQEEIAFGAMHPLKDQYYVRYGGAIHLIASRHYAHAAAPYTTYIDARLIEEGRRATALELPGFALTMKNGSWQRSPEQKELSSDRINAFVEEWQHARALSVEKATNKPVRDRVTITFEGEGGKAQTLTLGVVARAPELVLRRDDEGLEYRFPEETGKRLLNLAPAPDEQG